MIPRERMIAIRDIKYTTGTLEPSIIPGGSRNDEISRPSFAILCFGRLGALAGGDQPRSRLPRIQQSLEQRVLRFREWVDDGDSLIGKTLLHIFR